MKTTVTATVIAVSKNTNSFGLKSIIVLAPDGRGWQYYKSPYGGGDLPEEGTSREYVVTPQGTLQSTIWFSFECCQNLPKCPAKVARNVVREAKASVPA